MERKTLERRTVLKGGVAAVGMFGSGASTAMMAGLEPASADRRFRSKSFRRRALSARQFPPISIQTTLRRPSYRFS